MVYYPAIYVKIASKILHLLWYHNSHPGKTLHNPYEAAGDVGNYLV